ncbi:5-oxoprolinase subunit PxpB [Ilyobacter polytropus]|uniref:Allophanate hydrolase subunit 1 n=1 Tax=Ilyobacter polytropus (strain ATCC 51220 / DSM 2926 / LMG 16218 / CuHBu1) TaxID=572544 RepID=E3H7Y2_ILYPC|nr:5-oxoprolinase subunit PxpB [Ilyobacter polytropus]ADO82934.1 Allophanate hydrolase subunit 1 [Ilyobacter polytropus DSM 2926]
MRVIKIYKETRYLSAGDRALVIEFGNKISEEVNSKVRSMTIAIEKEGIEGVVEITPTYRSLTVHYDPMSTSYSSLIEHFEYLENKLEKIDIPLPEIIEIPTFYGGDQCPDIANVAQHNSISVDEVINIHSSKDYLIYMLGFTPGFPYLGGMDEKIATPRLETPRTKIKKGSVGIAGSQTGIYPTDSPGGWQIIGKTPVDLYNAYSDSPILLDSGNYIKFVPVSWDEYKKIEKAVKENRYKIKKYPKKERLI